MVQLAASKALNLVIVVRIHGGELPLTTLNRPGGRMSIVVTDAGSDSGQVRVTNTDSNKSETVPQRAADIAAASARLSPKK